MLTARNSVMVPVVHSDFEERLNTVKTAARSRIFGRYGLKDLFREHKIAPAGRGFSNKLKTFGKHVAEFGREAIFGSPITLAQQLSQRYKRTGSLARTIGGQIKDFYLSPGSPTWVKALSLGMPALELGNIILQGDPATRRGDIAHAVSGMVVAPFTARLGLLGIPVQGAVQGAARYVGSKFDPKLAPPPTPENLELNVPRHLMRVWKSRSPLNKTVNTDESSQTT